MPKKPPHNSFYYYMLDFRNEERSKGVIFKNFGEVADAAGPSWKNLPQSIKMKYEKIARQNKNDGVKYTSLGVSVAELEKRKTDEEFFDKSERKETASFIKSGLANNTIAYSEIFIMDVNVVCKTVTDFVIGEMTLIRFNIIDGLLDCYHEVINPAKVPLGYASDIKAACKEMGLDEPDEFKPESNYRHILAFILSLLRTSTDSDKLPPIYTMPEKVEAVEHFIVQLCLAAEEDAGTFRVHKLDRLFFYMVNGIASTMPLTIADQFPNELMALTVLLKDPYKYYSGIACQHHEDQDKASHCTQSRAKRWAFMVLAKVCPMLQVRMRPIKHMPPDAHVESVATKYSEVPKNKFKLFQNQDNSKDDQAGSVLSAFAIGVKIEDTVRRPKINYALASRCASQQSSAACVETNSSVDSGGGALSPFPRKTRLAGIGRGRVIADLFK